MLGVGLRARVKSASKIVCYVTDIEGSWDYWLRFLAISHAFIYKAEFGWDLKDNAYLVFGGDVCDRGPGDLRVMDALNGLKEKYPTRVHFIIGNRDCNKLRLPFEMSNQQLEKGTKVYWINEIRDSSDSAPDRLKWFLKNTMGSPNAFEERRKELEQLNVNSNDDAVVGSFLDSLQPEGRLIKYLKHSEIGVIIGDSLFIHGGLNSNNIRFVPPNYQTAVVAAQQDASESLPLPLPLPLPPAAHPSDFPPMPPTPAEAHLSSKASFLDPTSAGGISGGFTSTNSKSLSSVEGPENASAELTVEEWCQRVNAFAAEEVHHYIENKDSYIASGGEPWSVSGGYDHKQPGSRLIQQGMGFMPDKKANRSVIYSCFLNKGTPDLVKYEDDLESFLSTSDVVRVLVGHQPVGDVPLVIQGKNANIQVLSCDTSYSANVVWEVPYPDEVVTKEVERQFREHSTKFPITSSVDSRGVAVSEVLLLFEEGDSSTADPFMHGILSNGLYYESEIPSPNMKNEIVGQKVRDGWFVRCQVELPISSSPTPAAPPAAAPAVDEGEAVTTTTATNGGNEGGVDDTGAAGDAWRRYYVLCKIEGYKVNNKIVTQQELERLLSPAASSPVTADPSSGKDQSTTPPVEKPLQSPAKGDGKEEGREAVPVVPAVEAVEVGKGDGLCATCTTH